MILLATFLDYVYKGKHDGLVCGEHILCIHGIMSFVLDDFVWSYFNRQCNCLFYLNDSPAMFINTYTHFYHTLVLTLPPPGLAMLPWSNSLFYIQYKTSYLQQVKMRLVHASLHSTGRTLTVFVGVVALHYHNGVPQLPQTQLVIWLASQIHDI